MATKQIKHDLQYIYQSTDVSLEMRTQSELDDLVEALENRENTVVVLHGRRINLNIYLRFRE